MHEVLARPCIVFFFIEKSLLVLSVFIDVRKAFDTVIHKILLRRLSRLGIQGVILESFESYLNQRIIRVY